MAKALTWQERAEYAGRKAAHMRYELCRLFGDGNVTKGLHRLLRAERAARQQLVGLGIGKQQEAAAAAPTGAGAAAAACQGAL